MEHTLATFAPWMGNTSICNVSWSSLRNEKKIENVLSVYFIYAWQTAASTWWYVQIYLVFGGSWSELQVYNNTKLRNIYARQGLCIQEKSSNFLAVTNTFHFQQKIWNKNTDLSLNVQLVSNSCRHSALLGNSLILLLKKSDALSPSYQNWNFNFPGFTAQLSMVE